MDKRSSPALGVSADETLISAKKYYALQHYSQALPLFVKAAEAGNGEAALYLGFMYANGLGGLVKIRPTLMRYPAQCGVRAELQRDGAKGARAAGVPPLI
jgi:hypothetical protein